ncbi:hypothetical protein BLOT_003861 [Blomia tropicalis]|nr:hypothetical protein BLOT_003861 [Blomia tropicalis]
MEQNGPMNVVLRSLLIGNAFDRTKVDVRCVWRLFGLGDAFHARFPNRYVWRSSTGRDRNSLNPAYSEWCIQTFITSSIYSSLITSFNPLWNGQHYQVHSHRFPDNTNELKH